MAIDSGIFAAMGTRPKSFDEYTQAFDAREANALALKGARMQQQNALMAAQEDAAYKEAAKGFGSDTAANLNLLRSRGLAKQAQAYEDTILNQQKVRADIQQSNAAAGASQASANKTKLETFQAQLGTSKKILENANSPQALLAMLGASVQQGWYTPEEAQQIVSDMPQDPAQFVAWRDRQRMEMMDFEKKLAVAGNQANQLMIPDPNNPGRFMVNEQLVGAKARVAQAGAPVTYGTPMPMQVGEGGPTVMVQPPNRPGAKPQVMTDPATGAPLRPAAKPKAEGPMSVTLQKELIESDDAVQANQSVKATLEAALKLNKTAYSGYGAKERALVRSNLPGESAGANATIDLDNMMTGQALESLKVIFGGMPTEGERKILLDMQASADKTPVQREAIIKRAIAAADRRAAIAANKAKAIRDGTYLTEGAAVPVQPAPSGGDPVAEALKKYGG